MKFQTSKKVFAHIDCDSFFASCEVFRNPSLRGKRVCVGHEIILACTYEAKKVGIKTGTPIWEAKKILGNTGIYLPIDMALYGKMSKKVMGFLKENTQNIEIFSIDEAFVEITGLDELYQTDYEGVAKILQSRILQEIGLPVSIGVANTRIKAKIFSKIKKPYGIYIGLDTEGENELFAKLGIDKIPFIGRGYQEKLKYRMKTILDYKKYSFWTLHNLIGKNATSLWLELNGVNAVNYQKNNTLKSISRTRSFNQHITNDKNFLWGQLLFNIARMYEELIIHNFELRGISVGLKTKDLRRFRTEYLFPSHTLDRREVITQAQKMFENIFNPNELYRKTGITVWDLRPYTPKQMSIFDGENTNFEKQKKLEETIEKLNTKFGRFTLKVGASQEKQKESNMQKKHIS